MFLNLSLRRKRKGDGMAKAILILDMPENCFGCNLCHINSDGGEDRCQAFEVSRAVNSETYEKPDWCPLRKLPEKKETHTVLELHSNGRWTEGMKAGFNACLDEILGKRQDD